jgi:hypothetical protein
VKISEELGKSTEAVRRAREEFGKSPEELGKSSGEPWKRHRQDPVVGVSEGEKTRPHKIPVNMDIVFFIGFPSLFFFCLRSSHRKHNNDD